MEGSKDFAKRFMQRHGIPTAAYQTFTGENLEAGLKFLETLKAPYVLKADGLCAGKGVLILPTLDEAKKELKEMLSGMFGNASSRVVIEEFMSGIECSVFVLLAVNHALDVQHHGAVYAGDVGGYGFAERVRTLVVLIRDFNRTGSARFYGFTGPFRHRASTAGHHVVHHHRLVADVSEHKLAAHALVAYQQVAKVVRLLFKAHHLLFRPGIVVLGNAGDCRINRNQKGQGRYDSSQHHLSTIFLDKYTINWQYF